jgi:hypothetical protein
LVRSSAVFIVGHGAEISRLFYSGLDRKIMQRATVPIGAPFEDQLSDDSKKAEAISAP